MRAFLQGLRGQRLVVHARQHHQGDARRGRARAPQRFQSLCIGQPQVEQDNVDHMLGKMLLGVADASHLRDFQAMRVMLVDHFAEQARVAGVIFDEEKYLDRFLAHSGRAPRGSLTFVSQKSLMLFTRLSNASNCTGLLR